MPKIYGDQNLISRAKQAPAGDKSVYVNFDAINELPDQFEAAITDVKIDIQSDFTDVGNGTYMPTTDLMYRIAEACGISGGDNSITEPLIEEVDINAMMCRPLDAEPTYRKMTVGRKVRKYSTRMQEDGTSIRSSVCTSEYNVWERCLEAWSKEELYTEGYTKAGKFPPKYNSPYKRRAHFDAEMKHAHAKAETKAHCKTIRELAGMPTGYKAKDLVSGHLVFAKIRRSREALKIESAARLSALSKGFDQPQALLFADDPEPAVEQEVEQQGLSNQDLLSNGFRYYAKENMITSEDLKETVGKIVNWLESTPDAENNKTYWNKAVATMREVEKDIPQEMRTHWEV